MPGVQGDQGLSEGKSREEGFQIFRAGFVRRLSHTHYIAKNAADEGWHLIELKDGKWQCDCKSVGTECAHVYASQLMRTTSRLPSEQLDESRLKCRYCGGQDLGRSGFRYNSRGIIRRYKCNDCLRKFSIPHVQRDIQATPSEVAWLLNEIGMLTSKLAELLQEMNAKLESLTTH